MHELAVTENIYKTVVRSAQNAGADRVCSVTLHMGEGCDYVPEIIQQYFDMMAEGSIAEGAKILAHVIPAKIICRDCGGTFTRREAQAACPVCGSSNLKLQITSDCYIENMEIETDDEEDE